jgi:hypothetical protein
VQPLMERLKTLRGGFYPQPSLVIRGITHGGDRIYNIFMPLDKPTKPGTYPHGSQTRVYLVQGEDVTIYAFKSGELTIQSIDVDKGNIKASFFGIAEDLEDASRPKLKIDKGEFKYKKLHQSHPPTLPEAKRKS